MSKYTEPFISTFAQKEKNMATSLIIEYSRIIQRATMLSAFEAKMAFNTTGDRMFSDVRITAKDESAVKAYIQEGMNILISMLSRAFDITKTDTSTTSIWSIEGEDDNRLNISSTQFDEALASFALSRWLDNKLPQRAQAYASIFKDLSESSIKMSLKKRKPKRPTAQ